MIGDGGPASSRMTSRSVLAEATLERFEGKHLDALGWPSQSPDLNPAENLWSDLKIAVHEQKPSNLKEPEPFRPEEDKSNAANPRNCCKNGL